MNCCAIYCLCKCNAFSLLRSDKSKELCRALSSLPASVIYDVTNLYLFSSRNARNAFCDSLGAFLTVEITDLNLHNAGECSR